MRNRELARISADRLRASAAAKETPWQRQERINRERDAALKAASAQRVAEYQAAMAAGSEQ